MKKYDKIVQLDNDYKPVPAVDVLDRLPAGVYEVKSNLQGDVFFTQIKTNHDDLIDLPNTEYDVVVSELETFMLPLTKARFQKHGFVYKRSTLLYGPPGTGKTCIVNRVAQRVVKDGGIALFSPNPRLLEEAFKIIDSIQPETLVMVIFEELDQLMNRYESELLNLLDGEIQKSNVIYIGTTNYIDKIPARLRRPGRFSSVISVNFPSEQTRRYYLDYKLKDEDPTLVNIDAWVAKTHNFSIDELKETVSAVLCLGANLDQIIERIRVNKSELTTPSTSIDKLDDRVWSSIDLGDEQSEKNELADAFSVDHDDEESY